LNNLDQARTDFIKSLELFPEYHHACLMAEWSTMCLTSPDKDQIERLASISAIDPTCYLALICKAVALYLQGNYQDSLTVLEQSILLQADEWEAYFWKGMNLASIGYDKDAIAAIEQARALGIPAILLSPLRWLEQKKHFYIGYILPLLNGPLHD
jgi:Flp pilus assembly protein TadD